MAVEDATVPGSNEGEAEKGEKREEREKTHRARTSGDHTPFLYFLSLHG